VSTIEQKPRTWPASVVHSSIVGGRQGEDAVHHDVVLQLPWVRDSRKRGRVRKLKGRVKEAAGIVPGDGTLEREGSRQRAGGALEETLGRARRKAGELVDGVARAIKN
jgi:uncharacterized protein YjbJ (UPF0337 family)